MVDFSLNKVVVGLFCFQAWRPIYMGVGWRQTRCNNTRVSSLLRVELYQEPVPPEPTVTLSSESAVRIYSSCIITTHQTSDTIQRRYSVAFYGWNTALNLWTFSETKDWIMWENSQTADPISQIQPNFIIFSTWPAYLTYLPDLPTWPTYLTYLPDLPTWSTYLTYLPDLPAWPTYLTWFSIVT